MSKQSVLEWKEHLLKERYAPVTINAILAALNCFFKVMGWKNLRVKELRIQRKLFRSTTRSLSKAEWSTFSSLSGLIYHVKKQLSLLQIIFLCDRIS